MFYCVPTKKKDSSLNDARKENERKKKRKIEDDEEFAEMFALFKEIKNKKQKRMDVINEDIDEDESVVEELPTPAVMSTPLRLQTPFTS